MKPSVLIPIVLLLTGCASERIVLLPSADGRPSAVIVRNSQGQQVLNQPYATNVRRSTHHSVRQSEPELIEKRFAPSLAARPQRARSFLLYFDAGSDAPAVASMNEFELAKAEISKRGPAEVFVIGHTDRVGSDEDNDALSLRRVETVKSMLIAAGVVEADIETASRGERETLVQTPDGVANAINRRVEISVR